MTSWQDYLVGRRNEGIIKSSIPQLLEMGVNPIGFFKDILAGERFENALRFNENIPAPVMTPQQMSQALDTMIKDQSNPNNPNKDSNVANSLTVAKQALDKLNTAQVNKAKATQMQQQNMQQQQQATQQKTQQNMQPQQPQQQQQVNTGIQAPVNQGIRR